MSICTTQFNSLETATCTLCWLKMAENGGGTVEGGGGGGGGSGGNEGKELCGKGYRKATVRKKEAGRGVRTPTEMCCRMF